MQICRSMQLPFNRQCACTAWPRAAPLWWDELHIMLPIHNASRSRAPDPNPAVCARLAARVSSARRHATRAYMLRVKCSTAAHQQTLRRGGARTPPLTSPPPPNVVPPRFISGGVRPPGGVRPGRRRRAARRRAARAARGAPDGVAAAVARRGARRVQGRADGARRALRRRGACQACQARGVRPQAAARGGRGAPGRAREKGGVPGGGRVRCAATGAPSRCRRHSIRVMQP